MDIFDRASEAEERFRAAALAQHQQTASHAPSAHECDECGKPIPEARRRAVAGCRLCVTCQRLREETHRD